MKTYSMLVNFVNGGRLGIRTIIPINMPKYNISFTIFFIILMMNPIFLT